MTLRIFLLLALVTAAQAGAAVPSQPSAVDMLHAAVDAPEHVSFVGQVELLNIGVRGWSDASVFRVDHSAPDLTRRWYIAPSNLYGDAMISRGTSTYDVDVRQQRVVVTHNDVFGVHNGWYHDLALLTRNYRAVFGPDAVICGRATHVVALVNRYTGATTMRLWIDARTNLMLQRQVYATNGSLVSQMHFDDIRYVSSIPPTTFALPAHYATVQGPSRGVPSDDPARLIAHCGFAARVPRYLPEGFTPVAADLADEKGVHTLHVLYSDGVRTISLFENARGAATDMSGYHPVATTIGSLHAQKVVDGPTTLLAWSQGALHFALVGDLNGGELERIAASLVQ